MTELELKDLIELKYGSVRAFAVENDIPYTTVRSILERGVLNAKAETVFKICSILNIDPKAFVGDLSEEITSLASASDRLIDAINDTVVQLTTERKKNVLRFSGEELEAQNAELNEELTEYHVYEKLSAGEGEAYFEERNYDVVFFNKDIKHDLASWVYGDSMEPDYIDGSVALIKDTGFDYDGAIYAVDWDGQSYIKKVYKEKDGLRLVSLNDKYADKFASWEEQPRIIGKVIGNFVPLEI